MRDNIPLLCIVVPCYNEEEVLPQSSNILASTVQDLVSKGKVSSDSRIIFVDDGSRDSTWSIISSLHESNRVFTGIKLAHNEGHQRALYAGLMDALDRGCDISVSIDADLQDDVSVIEEMVDKYVAGAEIVYGVRNNRDTDTGFKRNTAQAYYRLMNKLGAEVVYNSADFRLMSSRTLKALAQYREANLFLRGMVPSLGFKSDEVYYARKERMAGESKYPLSKMLALAAEGITSFSIEPMHVMTTVGVVALFVALIMLIYTIVSCATGNAVAGWGSLMVSIWLVGGLVITSLGVTGEYVGKAYLETKQRPRYIVDVELD
ncbi:glycosyltransferase family 2 protein [Olsenella sp. KH3B4]|uniref:glycosyltransferase family 2 protein n=1 Tax=Olsenella sp. KH3B4 TaxID=1855394 RepID=UPI002570D6F2|nr:glycosyltransferase family 2 protein [Olsenella sp. KH3B4]